MTSPAASKGPRGSSSRVAARDRPPSPPIGRKRRARTGEVGHARVGFGRASEDAGLLHQLERALQVGQVGQVDVRALDVGQRRAAPGSAATPSMSGYSWVSVAKYVWLSGVEQEVDERLGGGRVRRASTGSRRRPR